ncbi:MAG: GIY-YIG nuclease family protein [Rhizomicrobium sp.]
MRHPGHYYVYILASKRHGTLYTDVTNDLPLRVSRHRNDVGSALTQKNGVHRLVWFELHDDVNAAIYREKCIKSRRRAWKLALIEAINPYWDNLFEDL